mgnify:CR=1 FL=1
MGRVDSVCPRKHAADPLIVKNGPPERKYDFGGRGRIVGKRNAGDCRTRPVLFDLDSIAQNTWTAVSLRVLSNSFTEEIFGNAAVYHPDWEVVDARCVLGRNPRCTGQVGNLRVHPARTWNRCIRWCRCPYNDCFHEL